MAFQESPSRSGSQPRAFPGRSFVLPTPKGGRRCPGCHSHIPAFAVIMEGGSTGGQKLQPEDGLTPWDPGLPSQSFPGRWSCRLLQGCWRFIGIDGAPFPAGSRQGKGECQTLTGSAEGGRRERWPCCVPSSLSFWGGEFLVREFSLSRIRPQLCRGVDPLRPCSTTPSWAGILLLQGGFIPARGCPSDLPSVGEFPAAAGNSASPPVRF